MSLLTNPILAKLLAKEDLTVRHGNYKTAWFDVSNRVLGLPIWKDHGKDVYDLLVGHEVGHALFTPAEGWHESNEEIKGCPRSYLNVIEDVRIERKIRESYPGLIAPMLRGYKVLKEKGFFGDTESYNFDEMKLIDKINLKSKLGRLISVPFNTEESKLLERAYVAETWSEVVQIVRDILAYTKENQPELMQLPAQTPNESGMEESDADSESSTEDPAQSGHDDTVNESASQPNTSESDEESKDSSESGEEDSGSGESEDDSKMSSATPEHSDDDISLTDEIYRSQESGLLDVDENGVQSMFISEMSKSVIDKAVVPFEELQAGRQKTMTMSKFEDFEKEVDLKSKSNAYFKGVKRSINPAVKEFEMRKAAYQYQRSSTAKTGSLDVNKVHSYKYNEDIFARVTREANAKNHGMFLLIDFSGSMYNTLYSVLDQVCHLVMFCKSVNIPFEVYGFSSNSSGLNMYRNSELDLDGAMDLDEVTVFQLTSSKLKKQAFEDSIYHLFLRKTANQIVNTKGRRYTTDDGEIPYFSDESFISSMEQYGSTPLNQALIISYHLVKSFIAKNNIEKMNFVTLTDGDSNTLRCYTRGNSEENRVQTTSTGRYHPKDYKLVLDKKLVTFEGNQRQPSIAILNEMSKRLGTNNLGFYIANDARSMYWRSQLVYENSTDTKQNWYWDRKDAAKEYKENRCITHTNTFGYDEYYVIRAGESLSAADDSFDGSQDSSKGQLTTQFKKFGKSKKVNKVLMTKIGKAVA